MTQNQNLAPLRNFLPKKQQMTTAARSLHNLLCNLRDKGANSIARLNKIPKWIRDVVFISIISRFVTYLSIFINWGFPTWANRKIDPFLCPGYHNPMYTTWWIYYFTQDLSWLLASYAFCKIASRVSNYLFLVGVIFFGYHLIDSIMYIWNFKQYSLLYIDIFWSMLLLIYTVFKGFKPETIARIKSLF